MSEWDGSERRGMDNISLQLMAEVRVMMAQHEKQESQVFDELKAGIRENRISSERRHDEMSERFAAMQHSTMTLLQTNNQTVSEIHKMFKTAFPEGDAESHRRAHEAWIEKEKSDREFWLKTKQHVTQWGIVVALGWAGLLLWAGFLKGPVG
jgi:Tfp pilus assembly protein PilV